MIFGRLRQAPSPGLLVIAFTVTLFALGAALTTVDPDPAPDAPPPFPGINGVLRVHPTNPRYFTTDGETALYLTGSHTWNNLVDVGVGTPSPFDFGAYLDFLAGYHHNFIRLWALELTDDYNSGLENLDATAPHPWLRTGPGSAVDGLPRFDLGAFDPAYFERLRQRVVAANSRGIYVSVMLFEGWGAQFSGVGRNSHPFDERNNVNGVHHGGTFTSIHTLVNPDITAIQETYVRKVLDTLNDLDGVMFEIANEAGGYSTSWQYHMIDFIRNYEAALPKQHLVGMTFQFRGGTHADLIESGADWISPGKDGGDWRSDPPVNDGGSIVISDSDHLWGIGGDRRWVWKTFTRGHHPIYMDRYDTHPVPHPTEEEARVAMGQTLAYAERLPLADVVPDSGVASSGYALAGAGHTLVYLPSAGTVTVELPAGEAGYDVEWFAPGSGEVRTEGPVTASGSTTFTAPFAGDAVLYLRRR